MRKESQGLGLQIGLCKYKIVCLLCFVSAQLQPTLASLDSSLICELELMQFILCMDSLVMRLVSAGYILQLPPLFLILLFLSSLKKKEKKRKEKNLDF